MKTNIKSNTIVWLAFGALIFTSCTSKYDEWNVNPYEATEEQMNRDNLKTGSLFIQMEQNIMTCGKDKTGNYQIIQGLAGDVYSGFMGATNNWKSGRNNTTYALAEDWYRAGFNESYQNIMNPWLSIKKVAETQSPGVYAMATIMKVEGMSRVTDMYGPIPYTKFGTGSLKVSYDSQKEVYYQFFNELDSAITTLTQLWKTNNLMTLMASNDFVYKGKIENWIKFGNSLRLRLAVRISEIDSDKAKNEGEAAINNEVGVMTKSSESAVLTQSSDLSFNNPLWEICNSFEDVRMGATIDSYMNGYNDPRIGKYFQVASDGKYHGVRNGIDIVTKQKYTNAPLSRLIFGQGGGMYWFNAAEVYFLRAEGALRGWNMNGTAKELYEGGIRCSFEQWGAGDASSYITNATNVPANYEDKSGDDNSTNAIGNITVAWYENAGTAEKLERIITQKYIATYPDGQEAWTEFRRTGYPRIFPNVVNYSGGTINTETQIRRLPYPQNEYENNTDNVNAALQLLGGADTGGTRLWWDVANK